MDKVTAESAIKAVHTFAEGVEDWGKFLEMADAMAINPMLPSEQGYKPPIEIMYGKMDSVIESICNQMEKKIDGDIYKAIMKVGINVDRDELLKALQYDRNQYEKGYADGKRDAEEALVRCRDCKHWKDDLMRDDLHICEIGYYFIEENGFCSYGERRTNNG